MPFTLKHSLAPALLGTSMALCLVAPGQAAPRHKAAPAAAPAAPSEVQPNAPTQQGGQNNRLVLTPTQKDWTKVCGKDTAANKQVCYTTRDFSAEAGKPPVLALAVYDIQGDDNRVVRMLMPIGLMLRPGFRLAVDNGPTTEGTYEICFPNGCFAETKIRGAQLETFKKGKQINVSVRNRDNAEVIFDVPLEGFGKAFDGPAIDPKVLQEQQQKLQAELQKRAEDERKKLEASQGKPAGGAAAPAAK